MKFCRVIMLLICVFSVPGLKAQKVDSIFVHLYTDSLRKGTFNYINIDGKMSDGTWLPLDSTHLIFTSDGGKFHGNNLWLEESTRIEKVNITVKLKSDPVMQKDFSVYIKQGDDEDLPTEKEILNKMRRRD